MNRYVYSRADNGYVVWETLKMPDGTVSIKPVAGFPEITRTKEWMNWMEEKRAKSPAPAV